MPAEGSILKRCTCTTTDGKRLGSRCPGLRRADSAWHPTHGLWTYQLELPPTAAGKRRQLRRVPYGLRNTRDAAVAERDHARALLDLAGADAAAQDEIATLLKKVPSGQPLPDRDAIARRLRAGVPAAITTTVGEYLGWWIQGRRIDENTKSAYAGHIRNYLIPHLGHLALDKLTAAHIADMYTAIAARNAAIRTARTSSSPTVRATVRGKKPMSVATMHRIRATLRKALNDAIRIHRLIEFNPARHVELPPTDPPKARVWTDTRVARWRATGHIPSPVMVWTPAQAGAFLDHVEEHDPDLYPIFALVLRRGPRRGEAVGLRTDQIDLAAATAVVSHQIAVHAGNTLVYKKVKTRHGDRTFALDTDTITDLTAYSKRRAAHQLAAGTGWPDSVRLPTPTPGGGMTDVEVDLFFRRPDGRPWHPDLLSARFERLVANADLPPVGIHDGRHGAATYTKAAGGDLHDIKELLGHSTITITADTYTSLLTDIERNTAENTAKLIPRKHRPPAA